MMSWEVVYPIGALLLLIALAYGYWSYKTRNRRNDPVTEEATRQLYEHPESYEERKAALDAELEPANDALGNPLHRH